MTVNATYFGSSSWLIEIGSHRILIDPWFRGDLVFPPGKWFLQGQLKQEHPIPTEISLILLSQGLEDHAHPETLTLFPRETPVIGSNNAIKVVEKLGFRSVHRLEPGERHSFDGINIEATAGAPVPLTENGYIITNQDESIYYEPHGYPDESIRPIHVKTLITPVVDVGLPVSINFIQGRQSLPKLLNCFKPKYILASTVGGEITFKGVFSDFIRIKTKLSEIEDIVPISTVLIDPRPGEKYNLE